MGAIAPAILIHEFDGFKEKRGGCRNSFKISTDRAEKAVELIDRISLKYGLPDPGRLPIHLEYGQMIQTSHSMRVAKVFETYANQMTEKEIEPVSFHSFRNIWKKLRHLLRFFHFDLICVQHSPNLNPYFAQATNFKYCLFKLAVQMDDFRKAL